MREADESTLICQAQRGDRVAFEELVTRYWSRIFHWLHGVTWCAHSAEDLTQDDPRCKPCRAINRTTRLAFSRYPKSLGGLPSRPGPRKGQLAGDAAANADPLTQAIQRASVTDNAPCCRVRLDLSTLREEMPYEEIAKLEISLVTARQNH